MVTSSLVGGARFYVASSETYRLPGFVLAFWWAGLGPRRGTAGQGWVVKPLALIGYRKNSQMALARISILTEE